MVALNIWLLALCDLANKALRIGGDRLLGPVHKPIPPAVADAHALQKSIFVKSPSEFRTTQTCRQVLPRFQNVVGHVGIMRVGIPPKRRTYGESVAVMALASGLKLRGST